MEATRLAPAGRACSKFVWQGRFQKKLGGSSACHSGRPAFCENHASPPSIKNHRSPGVRSYLIASISAIRRRSAGLRFGPASWKCAPAGAAVRPVQFFAGYGWLSAPRGLATLLPRLGVTPRGRNAADGGTAVQRIGALVAQRREVPRSAGGRRNSLANSKRSGINSAQRA
jgi:hypothetical protein